MDLPDVQTSVSSKMSGPKSQATNFAGGVEIVHLFC